MNLQEYRNKATEKLRVAKLMSLIPLNGATALDVGARDGFLSLQLVKYFDNVTAIDLIKRTLSMREFKLRLVILLVLNF